jgi:EAL and modified HD-GYP domain-containing signal transduction protein
LQKWVTLLLFAGEGGDFKSSPLLERAALRGRIMELLAKRITNDPTTADSAFMTGALSLIDILLERPITDILNEFNLSQDINYALICREGFLGNLIHIVEMLEQEKFGFIQEMLAKYNVPLEDLFSIEINAIVEYEKN